MRRYLKDIKKNTAGMNGRETAEYILTYYWYHILIAFAAVGLILFLIIHFAFGEERPLFTCVLVNQEINYDKDAQIEEAFADAAGIDEERIVFDSDFNISYGDTKLEGVNESSYEKFFFKWQNKELDAVIMPESFYQYCKELGGTFLDLSDMDTGSLPLYKDGENMTAVRIEETGFTQYLENETGEELLLAFPTDGTNREQCRLFLDFVENM